MAGLTSKQRWQIRRVFLQRRDDYSPTEASKVLGISRAKIVDGIKAGEIDAVKKHHTEYRLRWRTVAFLALMKWREEAIYDALGARADSVLPPLMRIESLTVTLPAYTIRMLEYQAALQGVSVDEVLRSLLHEESSTALLATPAIVHDIPGYREAVVFPDE